MSEATKVPEATKGINASLLLVPIPNKNRKDRAVDVFPFQFPM
jgi:hypothetical protein